jgi:tRNA dimethylallyltransferase
MLYLHALYHGLAALPPADAAVRRQLDAQAQLQGWPALHVELARIDPRAAARIAPADAQRIQRALEVWRVTGVPISEWQQRTQGARERYRWLRFALLPEDGPVGRAALRARLSQRLSAMLQAGLLQEVERLYARGDLTEQHAAVRAVGYRQLWRVFSASEAPDEAQQAALTATARLAKRQLTWLRREQELIRLDATAVGLAEALETQILAAARA